MICHWNCQLKPYSFPLRKNRVNYGHLLPSLSALGLINILSDLHSSVIVTYTLLILKCDTSLESSAQALCYSQSHSVNQSEFVSQVINQYVNLTQEQDHEWFKKIKGQPGIGSQLTSPFSIRVKRCFISIR